MNQVPVKRSFHASFRNVVLSDMGEDKNTGELIFLIHVGQRSALPPGFLKQYCKESLCHKLLRWGRALLGRALTPPLSFSELSYRYCRIPVPMRSAEGGDVFSRRKAEDAYTLLRNAGFCLYHAVDGWNAWTPYEEYCELMKRGLVTEPMQALVFDRTRRYMREMLTKPE